MTLSSLTFLFLFLPVALLLYLILPGRAKIYMLGIISLVFYAWGNPRDIVLLLFSVVFNYASALEMDELLYRRHWTLGKLSMIFTVIVNVAVLCVYKYSSAALPVGISFYTFSALSYIFDVYYDKAPAERNPVYVLVYIGLFSKVTSGPIVQYKDLYAQIRDHQVRLREDFGPGILLFLRGLFKKVLLADPLGLAFAQVTAVTEKTAGLAWLGVCFYAFQLYYDFSGYSDMAIGISRMLGFRFADNFDYPYTSGNLAEFWRRWHISLGAWFREYVYIPLGGNRCSVPRQMINLGAVWLLTGIWHGSTFNFVLWGIYHGAIIMFERFVLKKRLDKLPKVLRALGTDIIVFFGWVLFFSSGLGSAMRYYGQMFGSAGLGFWDAQASFILRQYFVLLLAGTAFAAPFLHNRYEEIMYYKQKGGFLVSAFLYLGLFALCIAEMVSSTYSTFLYAAF
ncbi:MAG: MBOAT family protein [Lachnospiraceae bacterium]|nr:MBOAT family protein [Lachnospiraceae bacterium]